MKLFCCQVRTGGTDLREECPCQGSDDITAHEVRHEVMYIELEVEEELGKGDRVLLQPIRQSICGLVVEYGPAIGN